MTPAGRRPMFRAARLTQAAALALLTAACTTPESADRPAVWTLATDDTLVALGVEQDAPAVLRLAPAAAKGIAAGPSTEPGAGWNWTPAPSRIPLVDAAYEGDVRRPLRWTFRGGKRGTEGDGVRITLRFACDDPALEWADVWRAFPGPGPVERTATVVNRSGRTLRLTLAPSLRLALAAPPGGGLENFWVEKGAGTPTDAGIHPEPVRSGYRFAQHSSPYCTQVDGPEMIPWLCLRDAAGGHGWYAGIAFSGRIAATLAADGDPLRLVLDAGIDPAGGEFRTRLEPGGAFELPPVFVGCFRGDADDAANRLHRYVERRVRPPVRDRRYPLVVNNSWGSGMAVDEALARRMIDAAAEIGVELFHVDAGWYREVGDWRPHPEKFPRGLAPVGEYARSKGMGFGLWTGWTQGGVADRGVEALSVRHPVMREWFGADLPADWRPAEFTGADVCLGSDAARDWCRSEVRRMVSEFRLDLLEHDQRMIVESCGRTTHRHEAHPGDVSYHAARGYYAVYDRIRREFPDLILEDCVNGGRMVDFGVARRVHYICYTDTYDPLSNRRGFYDASYPLPPSMCEAYVANLPGPTLGTFRTMLRSGMMGWLTLMCDPAAWTPEQRAAARKEIDLYKSWTRPLINRGNLYRVGPRPDGIRWDGVQYHDPETGKGILFAFRGTTPEAEHAFRLRGLRPEATYRLRFADGSSPPGKATGARLAADGVVVRLPEPGSSELVHLEESP